MKYTAILMIAFFLSAGCNMGERERALSDREKALARREQHVALREQSVKLKEAELQQRAQRLDSALSDTSIIYVPGLVGRWQVKMTCSETSCHGSAVGDTKQEVWEIYYSNRKVVARVLDGQKFTRIYSGTFSDGHLELTEEGEKMAGTANTQMHVRLTFAEEQTMEGAREIVRSGECRIVYSLHMKKTGI